MANIVLFNPERLTDSIKIELLELKYYLILMYSIYCNRSVGVIAND